MFGNIGIESAGTAANGSNLNAKIAKYSVKLPNVRVKTNPSRTLVFGIFWMPNVHIRPKPKNPVSLHHCIGVSESNSAAAFALKSSSAAVSLSLTLHPFPAAANPLFPPFLTSHPD